MATITGQGKQRPSQIYVEYENNQKTPGYEEFEPSRRGHVRRQMQAIRFGDFMGVRYNIKSHADPFEIYDVRNDSKQRSNLADRYPELQREMQDAVVRLRRPDPTAPRPYDDVWVPSSQPSEVKEGVRWQSYSTGSPWLPRLEDLQLREAGVSASIDGCPLPESSDALLVRGWIDIPRQGTYTFEIPDQAAAVLKLHQATVIDAGFPDARQPATGAILLDKGMHPFALYWSASSGAPSLSISGPDLQSQRVPDAMLFHSADE
jgi:hypothetical protein